MSVSTLPESTPASAQRSGRRATPARQPGKGSNAFRLGMVMLLAVFLIIGFFRLFAKPAEPSTVMIVAAGKDLAPGCKLGFRDLHMLNVPKNYYTNQMALSYPELVGAYTETYIPMGEPILKSQLLSGKKSLEAQLTANQRAFTLKLNDDQLVDHAIRSGDKVDIVVTSAAHSKQYTKTVCQDVTVLLATPKEILSSDKLKGTENNKITLALEPQDVEKVAQAAETAKIRLVLRNSQSRMKTILQGADERDLLPHEALRVEAPTASVAGGLGSANAELPAPPRSLPFMPAPPTAEAAAPAAVMPAPIQWVVEVFKGASKESQAFEQKQH